MPASEKVARTTISIDPLVMMKAKRRMRSLGIRKFSQYVALLLEKDQREGGDLTVVKKPYKIKEKRLTKCASYSGFYSARRAPFSRCSLTAIVTFDHNRFAHWSDNWSRRELSLSR